MTAAAQAQVLEHTAAGYGKQRLIPDVDIPVQFQVLEFRMMRDNP